MEFSSLEYWSRLTFPSLGDFPDPGIEPGSLALQADSLLPGISCYFLLQDLPNPEIEPRSPALRADSLPAESPRKLCKEDDYF